MKLSIIIPAFNAEPYITELLDVLMPQVTKEVEVLVIDDGSDKPFETKHKEIKVFRKANGGAASARNMGLDKAKGEYIAFIDADDIVDKEYISRILGKIEEEAPDYIYLSWCTLPGGWQCNVTLKSIKDEFPSFNLCVWNRIYKRDLIGRTRFNEKKLIAEDAEFIRLVETKGKKKAFIPVPVYFYRSDCPDSLTKRFAKGELDTKRIVYYLPHITKGMKSLVHEVKEADKEAEVIIMTNKNELPELSRYSMIVEPQRMKGTELRGEYTYLFEKITLPIKTQVVIYTAKTFHIGGIETWIYNFCQNMKEYYDIMVLYEEADIEQMTRLSKIVRTMQRNGQKIMCDTLIINRITDRVPDEISYKKTVQMIHSMKLSEAWSIPTGRNEYIAVSKAVKKSFGVGTVIHNMSYQDSEKKALLLVSATRLSTFEKGLNRMMSLAAGMEENDIPYIWLIFSDTKPQGMTQSMVWLPPRLNIKPYIEKADYLVQLSDQEGFCYSIIEAWEMGTPVITTPIEVLDEIGFAEGVNGYRVPFDMKNINFDKLLEVPDMMPQHFSNKKQVEQWRKVLGDTQPKRDYNPKRNVVIQATQEYYDTELKRTIRAGEKYVVTLERANKIKAAGFAIIREG